MKNTYQAFVILGLCTIASPARAGFIASVDTRSVSGTNGAIYLQFNPGLNADLASISIANFTLSDPGSLLANPAPAGSAGVTGDLGNPPLTIPNTNANNDFLEYLTFGSSLSFQVSFSLPGNLAGDSGSTFSFGLDAADGISPILTADPDGFIGQIGYDNTGVFTTTVLSPNGTISSLGTPEPGTWMLAFAALVAAAATCLIPKPASRIVNKRIVLGFFLNRKELTE
jgi:hypothetical protein